MQTPIHLSTNIPQGWGRPLLSPDDSPGGDGGKGKGDGDTITMSKAQYDALMKKGTGFDEAQTKLKDLEEAWSNMQVLLVEGHPEEKVRGAMKKLLLKQGYPEAKVESMLDERFSPAEPEEENERGEDRNVRNEELESLKKEVASLKGGTAKEREARLKDRLDQRLQSLTDKDTELGKHVEAIVKFQARANKGADESKIRAAVMGRVREDLKREFVNELTRRRNDTNSWDDSWIDDDKVAASATKRTGDGLRTVIGDPSILGRVPETAFADDEVQINKSDPVKPPEYKKGMSVGDAQDALNAWTADTLTRGLLEGAAGGASKI